VVYNPSELEKLEPGDKPDFVLANTPAVDPMIMKVLPLGGGSD
jgi:hypothetical protein